MESPHLIVQLTIDQLRTDYLEAFSSLYGEDGFKRLWREAMVIRNLQFSYKNRDRASSVATIYTGTTPSLHALMGERIGMDIVNMMWDRSAEAVENTASYEDCKMSLLKVLTIDTPFTEEEYLNAKKEDLAEKAFDASMATFKRKTEHMGRTKNCVGYLIGRRKVLNNGKSWGLILPINNPIISSRPIYPIRGWTMLVNLPWIIRIVRR